jgi:hypothetical protein
MVLIAPSIHLFLSYALLSISVAYVPPTPILRLGALAGILAYGVFGLLHFDHSGSSALWVAFCAQTTFAIMLFANYFLIITKAVPPLGLGAVEKLIWTVYNVTFNPRGIGMPWQIRNTPPFSRRHPSYVPTRFAFVIQRLATSALFFTMLKAFGITSRELFFANLRDGEYCWNWLVRLLEVSRYFY